jgi:DNA helicase-2/ATP-dependent DNA helicase PcrA
MASLVLPPRADAGFAAFAALMRRLAACRAPWPGELADAVAWLTPKLETRYDDTPQRIGDLEALERIAATFVSRERFLSELALDPPDTTSDEAGPPLIDEDYLVLSTIHSAKGRNGARSSF